VVSVVSPVVTGERRGGRGYHEHSGNQQNQDLLHFCSSNSSLMDLSRNFHFESPGGQQHTQISILDSQPQIEALSARQVCSQLLTLAGSGKFSMSVQGR
jgi:hypothetical protein